MQMYTVAARHIVLVARVDEEVRIRAGIDARFHKREGVLRHAGVVVVIVDDHQMSFQVACQVFQVTLYILSDCFAGYPYSVLRTSLRNTPSQ